MTQSNDTPKTLGDYAIDRKADAKATREAISNAAREADRATDKMAGLDLDGYEAASKAADAAVAEAAAATAIVRAMQGGTDHGTIPPTPIRRPGVDLAEWETALSNAQEASRKASAAQGVKRKKWLTIERRELAVDPADFREAVTAARDDAWERFVKAVTDAGIAGEQLRRYQKALGAQLELVPGKGDPLRPLGQLVYNVAEGIEYGDARAFRIREAQGGNL
ncbi:hypothetical protein [Curtobacterium flaccumfaciens]|uniref:hypothetical protein n=1 Tax=Curtobacterium flaccumfaciens TaxID=2035 RepID=UPI003994ED41